MHRVLDLVSSPSDVQLNLSQEVLRPYHGRRVYIENYGCQMNVSDSEIMRAVLERAGYLAADDLGDADVILVNTCAVRDHAEERAFGRLAELSSRKAAKPGLVLGVCGCMAQHVSDAIVKRAPYVDLVMGPDSYRRLPEALAETAAKLRAALAQD